MKHKTTLVTLMNAYQRHLDTRTRHAIRQGISAEETHSFHQLVITNHILPDQSNGYLVAPAMLTPVSRIVRPAGDCNMVYVANTARYLDRYPMPGGILLCECGRLHLNKLEESLNSLFCREYEPGVQETLTLLCWFELVNKSFALEWLSLSSKTDRQIQSWINTRLNRYADLRTTVDEYIFFSCFGCWTDYRPVSFPRR